MKSSMISIVLGASIALAGCGNARFSGDTDRKPSNEKSPNDPVPPTTTPTGDPSTNPPTGNPPTTSTTPTSTPSATTQVSENEVEFGSDKVFHIGDGQFSASSCRLQISAYNLHGTKYFFEFEVTAAATKVNININRVCGVDYDDTNFVRVMKDGNAINSQPLVAGTERFPLPTQTLEPGKYSIMVESLVNTQFVSGGDNDDFLVGRLNLKADKKIIGGNVRTE